MGPRGALGSLILTRQNCPGGGSHPNRRRSQATPEETRGVMQCRESWGAGGCQTDKEK